MSEIIAPETANLEAFWRNAVVHARLNPVEAYAGQDDLVSLMPVAFAFGNTRELADALCEKVISGQKRATSSYGPCYLASGLEYPTVGDLSIMCDGEGRPWALLQNERVAVVPFNGVGPEVALAEGEGDLDQWISDHETIFREEFGELGGDFSDSDDVVVEYFTVLYQIDGLADADEEIRMR